MVLHCHNVLYYKGVCYKSLGGIYGNNKSRQTNWKLREGLQLNEAMNESMDYMDELMAYAEAESRKSDLSSLIGLVSPEAALISDAINFGVRKFSDGPGDFDLSNSKYSMISPTKIREYEEGAQSALVEVEAELDSALVKRVGDIFQLHGSFLGKDKDGTSNYDFNPFNHDDNWWNRKRS